MNNNFSQTAAYIWSLADLLRGDFKQSQYGRIILPFTLLRRLEGVLKPTKSAVLAQYDNVSKMNLPEEAQEKMILRATGGLTFFNTSKMDLTKLGETGIKDNLESYIQSFSSDAREVFEYFNFTEFIGQLNDANLLYKIVQKVAKTDLDPATVSNREMGLIFEELIRRFSEGSNETAGEHFTPRDIVRLTTSLIFLEDEDALTDDGVIRTIYDPTAGTGGFLSAGAEYLNELNPGAKMVPFGQELNPESYAICKADMMIKGEEVKNIKLGNTLSNDQLANEQFDYMLSNPPFGVDWKKIEGDIKDEHTLQGFDGRFGAGLPRVSDGSLLFLMHLISKLRDSNSSDTQEGAGAATGGRIGIILNGSPLFTGGAGSGESEIRRYILEADLLEAIVALPTDMFYNTVIATYVWILSNKKISKRKGKVQLINGANLYSKMRKSLGSKRNEMSEDDIKTITRTFRDFEAIDARELNKPIEHKSNRGRQPTNTKIEAPKTFAAKIFHSHEFGYRRITIERPLRESYQFSDERIATLRFGSDKALISPMQWIYETFGADWSDDPSCTLYGQLDEVTDEIRAYLKANYNGLKEAKIKALLDSKIWLEAKACLLKGKALQAPKPRGMGVEQCDDMNTFEAALKNTCNVLNIKLETREKKAITTAVSWKNPAAEKVIKKVHKNTVAKPFYGLFKVDGTTNSESKVVEYKADGDLRNNENIALDPSQTVNQLNEAYFAKEVQPHIADAWIDASKTDAKDGEVGIIGYEIPFNRHFYQYQPPRPLAEIDADLDTVSAEIMALLQEVRC